METIAICFVTKIKGQKTSNIKIPILYDDKSDKVNELSGRLCWLMIHDQRLFYYKKAKYILNSAKIIDYEKIHKFAITLDKTRETNQDRHKRQIPEHPMSAAHIGSSWGKIKGHSYLPTLNGGLFSPK